MGPSVRVVEYGSKCPAAADRVECSSFEQVKATELVVAVGLELQLEKLDSYGEEVEETDPAFD